jgi:hypothetical protein
LVEHFDPVTPEQGKPFCQKDAVQRVPADGVKSFTEVKLEDGSWGTPFVAALDDVRRINEVFSNAATGDEACLVGVHKVGNEITELKGKAFGVNFKAAILKGDGPKVLWLVGAIFFREEDNVGFVVGPKVSGEVMKTGERLEEGGFNQVPIVFVKGRAKAIRSRAGVIVHGKEGLPDLL